MFTVHPRWLGANVPYFMDPFDRTSQLVEKDTLFWIISELAGISAYSSQLVVPNGPALLQRGKHAHFTICCRACELVALSFSMGGFAQAGNSLSHGGGRSVGVIAPIFSQLVYFHAPDNFVSVFENTHGDRYIHEWVLPGESVSSWTQMLTVTGAQDASAKHPGATPEAFASGIASGFQRACPSSFTAKGIYEGQPPA